MEGHKLTRESSLPFMLAGRAIVTFQNRETGNRFTFKIKGFKDNLHFVSVLTGNNNEGDYQYLGIIQDKSVFRLTKKSRITQEAQSYKVFQYVFSHLVRGANLPEQVEIWHEGHCGRCGRLLTVPESIADGIGPECKKKI
jgi:hypothetical protein